MRCFDLFGVFYNNPLFSTNPFSPQNPLYLLPELKIDENSKQIWIIKPYGKILNMKSPYLWTLSSGSSILPFHQLVLIVTRLLKQLDFGELTIHWYNEYQNYYKSQDDINKFGAPMNFFKQIFTCAFFGQTPYINAFGSREEFDQNPYIGGYYSIPVMEDDNKYEVEDLNGDVWKIYNGLYGNGICLTADLPQFTDPADKGDNIPRSQLIFSNLIPLCANQIDLGNGGLYNFKTFDANEIDISQYAMNHAIQPDVPPITPII